MTHSLASLWILLLFVNTLAVSQSGQYPKHEMRGVWIASVANIDWPSKPGLHPEQQQAEFKELIAFYKSLKFNAVFVQVRPAADAFYPSTLEPWSPWLTGKTGLPPEPLYDPLAFMINVAHQQGMEFHAWLNPYRAGVNVPETGPDSSSLAFQKPEWFVRYGKNMYFNPGLPEVRKHVTSVIADIVARYNVDGIHFDDYFYPYKITGEEFADSLAYGQHNESNASRDDWRRSNVDKLIEAVSDSIDALKPFVKFGISPFGVWRNNDKDPTGSATRAGQTCYDDLYADILKWLKEGWIDYVAPQIYWSIGFEAADYKTLAHWWNQNSYGKPVYIGQAAYRVNAHSDERWKQPSQLFHQIRINRSLAAIKGNIFFSAKSLKFNPLGVSDTLRNNIHRFHALLPVDQQEMEIDHPEGIPVYFIPAAKGITLHWSISNESSNSNALKYYVIYRFRRATRQSFKDSRNIVSIVPLQDVGQVSLSYTDTTIKRYRNYYYCVRIVNRYNQESRHVTTYGVRKKQKRCVVGF
jgi:uncharacterized lipoprotein YddW (UPF0748 family)